MIFDNKLKEFINRQIRSTLLEMHGDNIIYTNNATDRDLIYMHACVTIENDFSDDRIPTTQDINQAITRAYLLLYPQSEGANEEDSQFDDFEARNVAELMHEIKKRMRFDIPRPLAVPVKPRERNKK